MAKVTLGLGAVTLGASATYYFYPPTTGLENTGFLDAGTAQANSPTGANILTLRAAAQTDNSAFLNVQALINGGTNAGAVAKALSYDGATKRLTLDRYLAADSDTTTIYSLRGAPKVVRGITETNDIFSWFVKFSALTSTATVTFEATANGWDDAWVIPFDQTVANGTRTADVITFAVANGNMTFGVNRLTYQDVRMKLVTAAASAITAQVAVVINSQPLAIN